MDTAVSVTETMDRDQRTVRVCLCRPRSRCVVSAAAAAPERHCRCPARHNTLSKRLGEVLTISACLLSLVQWPTAMSAPSQRRRSIPEDRPRLWVNPCGFYSQSEDQSQIPEHDIPLQTDSEILNAIILSAGNALDSVEGFKNDYVKDTFDVDFTTHHNNWKEVRYDWLFRRDQVPKSLGIQTHPEHLQNIELDDFLKDAYRYLQIMAVALEQVAWDQDHHGSVFVSKFKDVEYKLRAVLCEIQMAMIERKVEPHPDVNRDVMSDEIRDVKDNAHRHLRDWVIFRDYMIVLEYIKDVFQYFYDNPSKITPS